MIYITLQVNIYSNILKTCVCVSSLLVKMSVNMSVNIHVNKYVNMISKILTPSFLELLFAAKNSLWFLYKDIF